MLRFTDIFVEARILLTHEQNDGSAGDLTGQSRRKEIVQILIENGRVASFGNCLKNADYPEAMHDRQSQDAYLRTFKVTGPAAELYDSSHPLILCGRCRDAVYDSFRKQQ